MPETTPLNVNETSNKIRRMVREYRAPVLGMAVFCIFSLLLTDSTCVLRTTTGLPCPGCGLTRATIALFHLDAVMAFYFNPMVFLVWPFSVIVIVLLLLKKTTIKKCTPFFIAFGVCMCLVYAVRMFLYFPGIEPMTYDFNSVFGRIINAIKFIIEKFQTNPI